MARRPMVAGNWKMHGSTTFTDELVTAVATGTASMNGIDSLVCPPYPYLVAAVNKAAESGLAVGAQNICEQTEQGAYTGEINGAMLSDVGCRYALVGHSERREYYAENDQRVAEKYVATQTAGLTPVLCIGETQAEREAGQTEAVLSRQLRAVIELAGIASFAKAVVAYEPVWAIGTGLTASPQQAQDTHAFIRGLLAEEDATIARDLRLLYGGSVKPGNASELFGCADVDGGLIGGAELDAESFIAICAAAQASVA